MRKILNILNIKYLLALFLSSFMLIDISSDLISYKLIFFFQILVIFFYFLDKIEFKISVEMLILILLFIYMMLNYFLFNLALNIKNYVLLFLIFFTPLCIFKHPKISNFDNKFFSFLVFFFLIIFLLSFKISNVGGGEFNNLYLVNYLSLGFHEIINVKRFGYHNLDVNYSAILLMMITHYLSLLYSKKKKFLIFAIIGFIILYFTKSKAGLLYYLMYFFFNYIKYFNNPKIIIIFLLLAFSFVALVSTILVAKVPTPFYSDPFDSEKQRKFIEWRFKNHKYFQDIILCTKNIDIVLNDPNHTDHKKIAQHFEFEKKYYQKKESIFDLNKTKNIAIPKDDIPKDDIAITERGFTCIFKLKRNNLLLFLNHSNLHRFYSYGSIIKEIYKNFDAFLFINPTSKIGEKKIYSPREIIQYFSTHSIVLDSLTRFGLIIFLLFILNFYFILKRLSNPSHIVPFLFGSLFLSFDTLMFIPLLYAIMSFNQKYE